MSSPAGERALPAGIRAGGCSVTVALVRETGSQRLPLPGVGLGAARGSLAGSGPRLHCGQSCPALARGCRPRSAGKGARLTREPTRLPGGYAPSGALGVCKAAPRQTLPKAEGEPGPVPPPLHAPEAPWSLAGRAPRGWAARGPCPPPPPCKACTGPGPRHHCCSHPGPPAPPPPPNEESLPDAGRSGWGGGLEAGPPGGCSTHLLGQPDGVVRELGAQLGVQVGGRRDLNHLLVPPLDGAVPLVEVHHVPVLVTCRGGGRRRHLAGPEQRPARAQGVSGSSQDRARRASPGPPAPGLASVPWGGCRPSSGAAAASFASGPRCWANRNRLHWLPPQRGITPPSWPPLCPPHTDTRSPWLPQPPSPFPYKPALCRCNQHCNLY